MNFRRDEFGRIEKITAYSNTVAAKCRQAGVGVMASLESYHPDQQNTPPRNNAAKLVNGEILSRLLAESERIYCETVRQAAQPQERSEATQNSQIVRERDEWVVKRHFQQVEKAKQRRAEQGALVEFQEWVTERVAATGKND